VQGILELLSLAILIIVFAQTRQIDEIHATTVPRIVDSSTTIKHHEILQSIIGLDVVNKELQQLLLSKGKWPKSSLCWSLGHGRGWKNPSCSKKYDSMEIQRHFQGSSFIWFMVGKNPHRKSLNQTLSKTLGLFDFVQSNDEDYKRELYNVFIKRRVFFCFKWCLVSRKNWLVWFS